MRGQLTARLVQLAQQNLRSHDGKGDFISLDAQCTGLFQLPQSTLGIA